tara:strand:- start:734 stop:1363 length:630 start_codon:yes stop_codon:yes gene_type:complete
MATKRKYAYYINGNKLAIIQREDALAGSSNDEYGMYKSPTESITDGLEIQYAYTPTYRINDASVTVAADSYDEDGTGLLKIVDTGNGLPTSGVTYIVISGSEKWNGLHKVNTLNAGYTILETKYNGAAVTEAFTVSTDVSVLQDESFELDISRYQANALVYYLKAKLAEDSGDIEMREFFMREFKRQLEKSTSALKRGPYMIQGFKEMR